MAGFVLICNGERLMNTTTKLHSITLAITTIFLYYLWNILYKNEFTIIPINYLINFVCSLSFYRMLYSIIDKICKKNRWLKEFIISYNYYEGTWIGYYTENDGTIKLFYEYCYQNFDAINFVGYAYDLDNKYFGKWTIVNPVINNQESKMTYYYEMESINNNHIEIGHAKASVIHGKKNRPYSLKGFAYSNNSMAMSSYAYKIDKGFVENISDLLEKAREIYNKQVVELYRLENSG